MGVMFDPLQTDHDRLVKKCIELCKLIGKSNVVAAFLSSLSTRDLGFRSSLSSFACGQNLPLHKKPQNVHKPAFCGICCEAMTLDSVDLNILNFERLKWGGLRHLKPSYIYLDLSVLSKHEIKEPCLEDLRLLKEIISALKTTPMKRLSDAEKALGSVIKSNKYERQGLITAFGYCGILNIPQIQPFHKEYIPASRRYESGYAKSDWPFPADLWLPKYGLNDDSIHYWFGEYL